MKNRPRRRGALQLFILATVLAAPEIAAGQQQSVIGTLHNLSVSGPGEIRALTETEVCKFCHVPHNAEAAVPLWGHALSSALYETPDLKNPSNSGSPAPQPDGSSRLCLSCHDGTVAIGDIAGQAKSLRMSGAERLTPQRRGFLGTDLTGSHPISFVLQETNTALEGEGGYPALNPLAAIQADPEVRLDSRGKMQCTTCHDPHSDSYYQPERVPHFWVKPSYEAVCLTCHALR